MEAMRSGGPCADAWRALCCDSGAWVILVDALGVVLDANSVAVRELGRHPSDLVGRSLGDLLPLPVARERLTFIARVVQSGQMLTVDSVLAGCRRFCTLRPLAASGGERSARVLMVSRNHVAGGPTAMVKAVHNDLGPLSALTERELEVLAMIAVGHSTARIAKELHRSVKTIEWHRVSLGSKLGVSNRVELARLAFRAGLASPFELPPLPTSTTLPIDAPK